MDSFNNINIITILILAVFTMPLLSGLLTPITNSRIQHSLLSLFGSIKLIAGFLLAVRFTQLFFSDEGNFSTAIFRILPVKELFLKYQHDIAAYLIVLFLFLSITLFILELLTIPLTKFLIVRMAGKISPVLNSMGIIPKRILSGIWQLPRAVFMVLIFSLMLNFYTSYINNPSTEEYIKHSKAYQIMNQYVLHPLINSEIARKLPVLINDSFKRAAEDFTPSNNDSEENSNYWKLPVIKYFNGMTLEEAVKSNPEIDQKAKKIVGDETDEKTKAYLIYQWISKNISYDKNKAAIIVQNPSHVDSGSIVTYQERRGICFDYSCLYISMCRAAGVKVRFVTGLGFTGSEWGDHSWNQIFDSKENRWINVDTTFASSGFDSFDTKDFSLFHKYDVVQAEW